MKLYDECRTCLRKSQLNKISSYPEDGRKAELIRQINYICDTMPESSAPPLLMREINVAHQKIYGGSIDYTEEKRKLDLMCDSYTDKIQSIIDSSENPLYTALKFAHVGNILDFGIFQSFDEDLLPYFLTEADKTVIEKKTYDDLIKNLEKAKNLTYLLDNCGEIAFDKLLLKQIKKSYPDLDITVVVRGGEILNDCTHFDTKLVGLDKIVRIIDNGTEIPGTYLPEISDKCKKLLYSADLIISKGLGNLETLGGCGLNIFYIFMCKCSAYTEMFNKPLMSGYMVRESKKLNF